MKTARAINTAVKYIGAGVAIVGFILVAFTLFQGRDATLEWIMFLVGDVAYLSARVFDLEHPRAFVVRIAEIHHLGDDVQIAEIHRYEGDQ